MCEPHSLANNSSTLESGYESICDTWLIVTLKSPQILNEPSCFSTGTMEAAYSENSIGDITPEATNLSSSVSTLFLNKKGTGLGIKNLGIALSLTLS